MYKIRPYITEKTVELVKKNKYTLLVDYNATKNQIEGLIKKYYHVSPISLKTLKTKYLQTTKMRKLSSDRGFKKVIVLLAKDKKIAGFEFETKETSGGKNAKTNEKQENEQKKVKNGKES